MEIDLSRIRTSRDAQAAGLPVFKIFSDGVLKAYTDGEGVRWFELTASSDATDLVGDFMTEKALKKMENAAPGTTMFLNHRYDVPEDVFGAVRVATITAEKLDKEGGGRNSVLLLNYKGVVETENPRAVQTHKYMEAGRVKLGASISVLILDATELKDGRRAIDDIYYLECSVVGIPCNRQSWAKAASKALNLIEKSSLVSGAEGQDVAAKQADASTALVKETDMTASYQPKIAKKGMFNDALEAEESSIYHLINILVEALYDLYFQAVYYNTDVDPEAELALICDEFKAVMLERFLPRLMPEDSEEKSAKVERLAKVCALLGGSGPVTKGIESILKEGRRNSDSDLKMIEQIHGLAVNLGAACNPA
jgi:hypothetical protein